MPNLNSEQLRNVVLLSHSGAGKTMLSEAMLYTTGGTNRLGTTADGTTISDYEPEEQKRTASVQLSLIPCSWKDHKVNLIDTPGYADFRGEAISGTRVADSAIIVVSAPSGVEVGTHQMWKMADERALPRVLVVNKMDRENVDFQRVLESIQENFGRGCVAVQIPVGAEADFSGSINLLSEQQDIPDDLQEQVDTAREQLTEAIAETDDALATKYLEGQPLSHEEMTKGLKAGVASGTIVPVIVSSATTNVGAAEVLDMIVDLLPSPTETSSVKATRPDSDEEINLSSKPDEPIAALVFKTTADPFVGKLSYLRVYSGVFESDSQSWNATKAEEERVGQVFTIMGKTQEPISGLVPGDIGAVAKLSSVVTGDTLSAKGNPIVLEGLVFPSPVYNMAVSPKSKADLDKMTGALTRITEDDPSLKITREPDTHEILLGGLGDTHVEVAVEKMARKFGAEIELSTPKVPYRETVSSSTTAEYRHKKQSGGHGQFAHVLLEITPLPRGSGFEFDQRVVGGSVPREYIPSVQKGCQKALDQGVLAGYPIVDLKATLYDGTFHPVDSSGVSFEIAGGHALSDGIKNASPLLLEPVMSVQVTVPESDTGEVMGDLNGKRARILGMTPLGDGLTMVEAEAPQAEMLRYATDLRSQTQGRGTFSIKFGHYEEVPAHVVQRIVDSHEEANVGA